MALPFVDPTDRSIRGVVGGLLIVATPEEKQFFRDKVRGGMSIEDAAQEMALLIEERTSGAFQ